MDCPYHTHCIIYVQQSHSSTPTEMFLWTVHLPTIPFKHSHKHVCGSIEVCVVWTVHLCPTSHSSTPTDMFLVYIDISVGVLECLCVWYGQSIYVQQSHSSTPTEMFLGVYRSVCGMDCPYHIPFTPTDLYIWTHLCPTNIKH